MMRKLTILLDEHVYERLQAAVGPRRIGRFIEGLVRDRLLDAQLDDGYAAMASDEAREAEAREWTEATIEDVSREAR